MKVGAPTTRGCAAKGVLDCQAERRKRCDACVKAWPCARIARSLLLRRLP